MPGKKIKTFWKILLFTLLSAVIIAVIAYMLVSHFYPLHYFDIVSEYAKEYSLAPELVMAVIHAESKFDKDAVSAVGASGLMQIMEETAYWLVPQMGIEDFDYGQIFDPRINIQIGCFYLDMQIKRFEDIETALCAYNAGGGNVQRWLENPDYSSDGKTLDHIPFSETQNYVERVFANQKIYSLILRFLPLPSR
ncbi:MAG: lytic transglycosylase domain-containing protein [Oscillospiraceae bacterium]|nr:lytic transglycosylase domain-containing protein [Oscillospiraceae bacterium]